MKTIVIEPNRQSLEEIVTQLKKWSDVHIIETYTGISNDIKDILNKKIDIIFIDYHLSDKYNMDFVVELVQQCPSIQIVLTKWNAHHLEESKISEIQFLSKPIQKDALEKVMEKIYHKRNKMMEQAKPLKQQKQIIESNQLIAEKNKGKMESIFLKIIKE